MMKQITLLYRCSNCSTIFTLDVNIPYDSFIELIDSYIYNTTPPANIAIKYNVSDCEKHKCEQPCLVPKGLEDIYGKDAVRFGIGKLIGYTVTELPDNDQNDRPSIHLVKC